MLGLVKPELVLIDKPQYNTGANDAARDRGKSFDPFGSRCPKPDQAAIINQTIAAIRFVWNRAWLPAVEHAEMQRWDHARAHGYSEEMTKEERGDLWKAAWKAHPDPCGGTSLTKAVKSKINEDEDWVWFDDRNIPKTPIHRAARIADPDSGGIRWGAGE